MVTRSFTTKFTVCQNKLNLSTYDTTNDRLYHAMLIKLQWSERNLDGGRFARFSNARLSEDVVVPHLEYDVTVPHTQCLLFNVERCIEWVADNTTGKWSFDIKEQNGNTVMVMYFSDVTDAAMFAVSL